MRVAQARSARAGYTLLEALIAAALLLLLLSSAVLAARGGMGAFRTTQDASGAETRVRRALDRVVFELLSAGASELIPNPTGDFGTAELQYRKPIGLVGTAPQWGPTFSLAFEYATGEGDDDVDNDGNGLVDDGVLVMTRDVGGNEHRVVLCHNVAELLEGEIANGDDDNGNDVRDEAGFNVHRIGDVLLVRLSVQEPAETGNIVRTLETSVRLRN
jgi:type II secretory pathway pseudopilin PulG